MKDYQVAKHNLPLFMRELERELDDHTFLLVTTQDPRTGKWGMTRLWRMWMASTADWMAARGATMPLYIDANGVPHGSRAYNPDDAHEAFTAHWLGVDDQGRRLSWSKSGREDMRAATKGERFIAMQRHEDWALEKGLSLFQPRDSEYRQLQQEQAA